MIIGFAGTPGSGKTYEAVKKILDNLQWGRVVYTNIDGIVDSSCQEMIKTTCGLSDLALKKQLHYLDEGQVPEFWMHVEPGSLIVLDEVQKVFSSREWQTTKNNLFASWASTHRHQGFDLVLISQAVERIDSAVRALYEWTYVFRKMNFFGSAVQKKYICYAYGGDDTGSDPLKKTVRTYDQAVFACYKSYVTKDVKELGVMQHVNVLKHPVFFAIPVVLAFTLYMLFSKSSFATGDLFGTDKVMKQYSQQKTMTVRPGQSNREQSPSVAPAGVRPMDRNGLLVYTNKG